MKNKYKVLGAFALTILMVACNSNNNSSLSSVSSSTSSNNVSTSSSEVDYKTNSDFEKAKVTYTDKDNVEKNLNMQTIYTNSGNPHLDPTEEQHVLVVPFGFTDDNLQEVQSKENIDRITTTFFGTQEEIDAVGGWTSVANYYTTSSFGKSKFEGKVVPAWVNYGKSSSQFEKDSNGNLGIYAAEYARKWYIDEYAKENHGDLGVDAEPLSYFDQNKDGYLDLVWIVYSHPTGTVNDWWAYVTYNTSSTSSTRAPGVKTLGFASIQWMQESVGGHDPHTYIHETGHTYGLDDYYDYRSQWAPMAGIDMMDHNLGDHGAFSKFTLGWLQPLVVDDSAIITLRPATTTGDCFILPSPGYNGTAFDEYMMVELMAPVGLAEKDYKNGYTGTAGYSKAGIRITHIDARVYKSDHDTYLADNPEEGIDFRVCNSFGGRPGAGNNLKSDTDYWERKDGTLHYFTLSSLMESSIAEKNWTNTGTYSASNDSLFVKGDRFNLNSTTGWADTYMPSGTNLWNKAKKITGWVNNTTQEYEIDETCTFDYSLRVLSIDKTDDGSYEAKVQVTKAA